MPWASSAPSGLLLVPQRPAQVVVQVGRQLIEPPQERFVDGQFVQPLRVDLPEQRHRVMSDLLPQLRINDLEQALGGLVPRPAQVDREPVESGKTIGHMCAHGEPAEGFHASTDDSDVTSGPELAESLQALLEATRRLGRLQLVFLFDEIERVPLDAWGGGFLAYWRMLLNNMGELSRCLSAVFSGAGGIYRIAQDAGSPLGNILAWHELELFSYEETARLVREPSGQAWPDALAERIFEASGGQPCLIQYLMQRVCDGDTSPLDSARGGSGQAPSASSGAAVPSDSRGSEARGQAAWSESVASAEQRFLREHSTIFSSWWQGFDETAQAIYASLADGGPVPEGELIARSSGPGKRALDVLSHTGVVRWDRARGPSRRPGRCSTPGHGSARYRVGS